MAWIDSNNSSACRANRLFGCPASEQKQPTQPNRPALRAREIRGRRNSAEEDEKVDKCPEEALFAFRAHGKDLADRACLNTGAQPIGGS